MLKHLSQWEVKWLLKLNATVCPTSGYLPATGYLTAHYPGFPAPCWNNGSPCLKTATMTAWRLSR